MKTKKTTKIPNIPFVGQKVYLNSCYYISHGSDDVAGGVATICAVEKISKTNYYVKLKGFPGCEYPYSCFTDVVEQAKRKKEFGKQKAHRSPDIDTPWIEEGDLVGGTINGRAYHGEVYKGPPVW